MRVTVEPGVELQVQDLGRGPVVVLIAGFGLDHRVWDRQVRTLSKSHRVVCVDQRGHGRSDSPLHGYDLPRLAEDLLIVLDHLQIERCSLVGWSFGGQVALQVALQRPEKINSIVLVASNGVRASRSSSFPFGPPEEAILKALVDAEVKDRLTARRATISAGFAMPPSQELVNFLVNLSLAMPSWAAIPCYKSMLQTDLVDQLPSVATTVHQIMGTNDSVQSVEGAEWLRNRLSAGRLVELEGVGHYPMFENAELFDRHLQKLLEEDSDSLESSPSDPDYDDRNRH